MLSIFVTPYALERLIECLFEIHTPLVLLICFPLVNGTCYELCMAIIEQNIMILFETLAGIV